MQEAPTLRPLGVGDIIDRVIRLLRTRPMLYVLIAGLPALVVAILQRLVGISRTFDLNDFIPTVSPSGQPVAPTIANQPVGVAPTLVVLFAIVLSLVQSAALVEAVSRRYLGGDVTVRDAYVRGLRATPRIIGSLVVAILLLSLLVGVPLLVLAVVAGATNLPLLFLLWLPIFFVVLPFFLVSWSVALPAVQLEGAGPVASLRRSWRLVSGNRWRVIGLVLLLSVVQTVIGVLFTTIFLVSFVTDAAARTVLQEVANLASTVIVTPLSYATLVVLYYDLRVRKEALDLQLAAEALARA